MVAQASPKQCPICGAEEPEPWYEAEMNEAIRPYARAYIMPPVSWYPSLLDALTAWGEHIGLLEVENAGQDAGRV